MVEARRYFASPKSLLFGPLRQGRERGRALGLAMDARRRALGGVGAGPEALAVAAEARPEAY
eukprot:1660883-Lingulodinium_polyedra.AAC.1